MTPGYMPKISHFSRILGLKGLTDRLQNGKLIPLKNGLWKYWSHLIYTCTGLLSLLWKHRVDDVRHT